MSGHGDSHAAGDLVAERVRDCVKALRAASNIRADRLAEAIGVSRRGFFMRLSGDRDFTVREVATLANVFGVPDDDLYAGRLNLSGLRAVPDPDNPGPGLPDPNKGSCSLWITDAVTLIPAPRGSTENLSPAVSREPHVSHVPAA